ncbi:MAG: hypothetical protein AVDCRST_MAG02-4355 [uncultured Rubrobacteraceae bacterium]|uniref:Uncharacterized protein n=1 Tax=uncultured Rubrobacteraceae bacterium TaxID=349277 RepID=A0A6J4RRM7_9ACTN|nr:MAG: hypothetical protein AVDCRST_MAG02-4355 [uncultured Rubrobacteraceae bacterium]
MPDTEEKISRASFLKLGVLGASAAALALVSGCGGEEDDDEGEDD